MQANNQNQTKQIKKPILSLRRFRKLKDNPFAIFDKETNSVYHAGSIQDAEILTALLNKLHRTGTIETQI